MTDRKDLWSDDDLAWLRLVWEAPYPVDDIVKACGRTRTAVRSMVQIIACRRPAGYRGPAMKRFHDALPGPIPPFPGDPLGSEPRGNAGKSKAEVLPRKWRRRCQACPTIFVSEQVEDVFCPQCVAAFGETQAREARRRRPPEKSDIKTSGWLSS